MYNGFIDLYIQTFAQETRMKKQLANAITLSRIFLSLPLIIVFDCATIAEKYTAFILCIILGLTDKLDGYIARSRYGEVTALGKKLDPFADKISITLIYALILWHHLIPFWIFSLIIIRDLFVTFLRGSVEKMGRVISAQFSGKLKTCIAYTLAIVLIGKIVPKNTDSSSTLSAVETVIGYINALPEWLTLSLMYLLALITMITFYDYIRTYKKIIHQSQEA